MFLKEMPTYSQINMNGYRHKTANAKRLVVLIEIRMRTAFNITIGIMNPFSAYNYTVACCTFSKPKCSCSF